ncbi:hypothetical protein HDF18_23175 [Mucilaginibacter sp. X5P1]|uniref:hypothetical protein n=1 Tax=Mucilaginibacter sp. X5P1 TaxID=2723088 RepID=UPI00161D24F2|nr:hypothetical protein [Mucilaginibacter sp. X5P1]MBB6141378.1 hypothetical protein [Mucilaginibacter sp. X5P1]
MKLYLSLTHPQNQQISEIANTIKEYYPVGLEVNSEGYKSYPGIINLDNTIGQHMTHYNAYIAPWRSFLKSLPKGFKSKIHNCGFAHQTSYGGELLLEKHEDKVLIRKKKLIFNVSWLGNFYTIYGVDETFVLDKKAMGEFDLHYHAINVITVSPHKEFENGFNYLQTAINKQFVDYKFIPFKLCSFYIKDLQTPYSYPNEATVYNAIFNESLDRVHLPSIYLRGDRRYGLEPGDTKVRLLLPPKST